MIGVAQKASVNELHQQSIVLTRCPLGDFTEILDKWFSTYI